MATRTSNSGYLLITGSGGFLGSNLARYFGASRKCLTPRSCELDLTDSYAVRKYFEQNDIGAIVHCSSVGGVRGVADSEDTLVKNIAMFENLVECAQSQIPLVTFGSGAQYDKSRALVKVGESELGKFVPKDLYGLSKLKIARMAENRGNIVCLNIFGCFGMGERPSRLPAYSIVQCIKNENITINRDCIFDYLFVDDLCRGVERIIENGSIDRVMNFTPFDSVRLSEFARMAREITNVDVKISVVSKSDGNEYTGDNSLFIKNVPDFKFTSLRKAISSYAETLNKIYFR